MTDKPMRVVEVLRLFFGKLTMNELKALGKSERRELAELAAEELNVTLAND